MLVCSQFQWFYAATEERRQWVFSIQSSPVVIEGDHIFQCFQAAIVHVGPGNFDVAQRGCFEGANLCAVLCHRKAAQFRHVFLGQYGDVDICTGMFCLQEFSSGCGFLATYTLETDTDIMKAVVGKQCRGLFDAMAGDAAPLAGKQLQATSPGVIQGICFTAILVAVKSRIA